MSDVFVRKGVKALTRAFKSFLRRYGDDNILVSDYYSVAAGFTISIVKWIESQLKMTPEQKAAHRDALLDTFHEHLDEE